MKYIDEKIMNALKKLRLTTCTNAELARKLGFSRNHISKLFNNKCTHFKSKTWERLKPILFVTNTMSITTAPNDSELEILKRDAKLAQLHLQIAYLERKVKRLQELNFKEGERDEN